MNEAAICLKSPIDVAAVSDIKDQHQQLVLLHRVNDSIIANSHAVGSMTGELCTSKGPGVFRELLRLCQDPALNLFWQLAVGSFSRNCEDDLVTGAQARDSCFNASRVTPRLVFR